VHANALAVAGGECYYRNMVLGRGTSWNLRDSHFLEVLQLVEAHLRCVHSRRWCRCWWRPMLWVLQSGSCPCAEALK
jgi:hypothetical protein